MRRGKNALVLTIGAFVIVVLQACSFIGGGSGQPTVSITSPASGATVPVNVPVVVQAMASDPDGPGVVRVDLQVDGVAVDTFETTTPQASILVELLFTPGSEGALSVSVVTFRADGTPSPTATIALQVVGLTAEPAAEVPSQPESSGESSGGDVPPVQDSGVDISNLVFARANVLVNIREKPGPGCRIIAEVAQGDIIELLEVNDDPVNFWYKVPLTIRQSAGGVTGLNYIPSSESEQYGWVFQGDIGTNFTLLQPDDALPRVRELGCLFCGDGVCSAEIGEACDQCISDCGVCPFCGDGAVNQPSEQCDGGGCGDGFTCNAACQCEALPTVPPPPDPVCGNGILEPGEACENHSDCPDDLICNSFCGCEVFL